MYVQHKQLVLYVINEDHSSYIALIYIALIFTLLCTLLICFVIVENHNSYRQCYIVPVEMLAVDSLFIIQCSN